MKSVSVSFIVLLIVTVAGRSLSTEVTPTNSGRAELQATLTAHLSQDRFHAAAWAVKVVSLDSGETFFEHNPHKLLKPASNAKLFTGAAVLDRLGPDFRIKTSLYAATRPEKSGTLRGDLIIYGRGDPCFAERFNGGSYSNILKPIVDAIAAAGIKQIKGDLIGDESYFRGPPFGTQWTWDDLQQYYGAEFSALTVQDNVVDLIIKPGDRIGAPCEIVTLPSTSYLAFSNRVVTVEADSKRRVSIYRPVGENVVYVSGWMPLTGSNLVDSVSVHDPARWFVTLLKEALARRGIRVTGNARTMNWLDRQIAPLVLDDLVELGSVQSAPLRTILSRMMKPSQNLYAHLLLLQLGSNWRTPPMPEQTTEDVGLAEMNTFLKTAGVRDGDVLLEEGSGLSRGALVTPNSTIALLQHMRRHPHFEVFRESLPVAGVDGTLRNRMRNTAAAGNVRAKTGTLRYVNTLSGYLTNKAGENLAFSLMLNNYDGDAARAALDKIVVTLAEHDPR
ncbi:MAG: D-alanyl-D-alanine carboxypeptidase/D-alanyl-D-alanine-endopeptidase [Verrucomicrobia bacterium]|nr:D-alanyl-D-alanine carboxypeptidase/D-alanyl-D-alanine-endopeptidase [Verrucomicrobiota bacterium]